MSYTNTGHGVILEAVVCQDCSGPIIFGKIPRNSSKEFLKKKMSTPGKRKKKDTGHRWHAMESGRGMKKNSSGAAEETSLGHTHAAGLDGSPPRWEWKRRVWRSWLPENDVQSAIWAGSKLSPAAQNCYRDWNLQTMEGSRSLTHTYHIASNSYSMIFMLRTTLFPSSEDIS